LTNINLSKTFIMKRTSFLRLAGVVCIIAFGTVLMAFKNAAPSLRVAEKPAQFDVGSVGGLMLIT
jgi:hypothetical protein